MNKEYDYIIATEKFEDSSAVILKNGLEFLKWFSEEKPISKKIYFYGDSSKIHEMEHMNDFLNYYYKVKNVCEDEMKLYNDNLLKEENSFLKEGIEQYVAVNSGGKFIRAALIALGYHSFGFDDDNYLSLSMALELFQTSILIHDDIIDMADKRRGKPTIPLRYRNIYSMPANSNSSFDDKLREVSDSMALCLGDLGLYLSNQVIVKNYFNNPNLPAVLEYYNDIAIKTCKGEMVDVILPFFEEYYGPTKDLENNILEIYRLKTSWYTVVGPYVLGCKLAGVSQDKIVKLEDALINLGVAFQIKDDILGVYGDENKIGKSTLSDAAEFKQTLLYSYIINTKFKNDFLKLYGNSDLKEEDMDKIRKMFDESGALEYASNFMDRLFNESLSKIMALEFLDDSKKSILLGFAEYLKVRSK